MLRCPPGFVLLKWTLVFRASQRSNSLAASSPQCPSVPCPSSTVELSRSRFQERTWEDEASLVAAKGCSLTPFLQALTVL